MLKKEFEIKGYFRPAITVNGERLLCLFPANSSVLLTKKMLKSYDTVEPVSIKIEPWSNDDAEAVSRYFHKVLRFYYISGQCSSDSLDDLKDEMMRKYGKGFIEFLYMDGGKPIRVKSEKDIPQGTEYFGLVGSWGRYTRNQMYETLEGMKAEMKDNAQISGKAFDRLIGER